MKWREEDHRPCNEELRQRDIAYRWKMPEPVLLDEQQQKEVGPCWTYGLTIKQRVEDLYKNAYVKKEKEIDRSSWGMPEKGQYGICRAMQSGESSKRQKGKMTKI